MKVWQLIKQQVELNKYNSKDMEVLYKKNFNKSNTVLPVYSTRPILTGYFDKYLYRYSFTAKFIEDCGLAIRFNRHYNRFDFGAPFGHSYLFHYINISSEAAFEILKRKSKLRPIEEIKLEML